VRLPLDEPPFDAVVRPLVTAADRRRLTHGLLRRAVFRAVDGEWTVPCGPARGRFRPADPYELHRFQRLIGERAFIEDLLTEVRVDDVVWDVGAQIGLHAVLVGSLLEGGQIECFEPNPRNVERLRTHLELNDVPAEVHRLALGATAGTAQFDRQSYAFGEGGREVATTESTTDTFTADRRRGDDLVGQACARPDVVKMDIEGGEVDAIRGMEGTLETTRSAFVEVHPEMAGRGAPTVREDLRRLGFVTRTLDADTPGPFRIVARR
jgi:FkbM family methyltransferase